MIGILLQHKWKMTLRTGFWRQGWGVRILLGFLVLYFGTGFTLLGIFLPELLTEVTGRSDSPGLILGGFVLYYMLLDIVIRFFLQDLNVLNIQHYLTQPIRRSKLIHFLLGTSAFNFFNLLPLFLIIPFTIRGIAPENGNLQALIWMFGMLGIVMIDHFLAIYLKRVMAIKPVVFIVLGLIIGLLITGESLEWIDLTSLSEPLFGSLSMTYWPVIPVFAFAGLTYAINYRFLLNNTYIDLWTRKSDRSVSGTGFEFLARKGMIGGLIANEMRLIFRNKRTRNAAFMTVFGAVYGLIFYSSSVYSESWMWLLFAGIFMTGIFMINYGQFLVAWESAYFDGILTRPLSIPDYFRSKLYFMIFSCVITYILTLPYAFFGWHALAINTAAFLFNVGFNTHVLIYASTYLKKRIDLSKGSAFNYQGTSATQFVIVIPMMLLPILLMSPFQLMGKPEWGLVLVGGTGIISLLFSKYWIAESVRHFRDRKYTNAAGFRIRD